MELEDGTVNKPALSISRTSDMLVWSGKLVITRSKTLVPRMGLR